MRIILLLVLIQLGGLLNAKSVSNSPETFLPVPFTGLMYARHEGTFYDQQANEWKAIATGECATDEAWFHYYKTAQYSNRFGSGEHDLKTILVAAEKQCNPEGFDLNYLQFVADNRPVARWEKLMRAHAIDPERIEAYTAITGRYEVLGEREKRDDILRRIHTRNPISAGVMAYNFNQLQSVGQKGILLTNGDADTFPSWLLQSYYGIRPDVRVINLALLLGYEPYRENVFRELGLAFFGGPAPDFSALIQHLTNQPRPLYLAATTRSYFEQLESSRLYLTGLAFWYTDEEVDNIGVLADNFANKWRLDQLRQPLIAGPVQAVADELNQNYLPALLELYDYRQERSNGSLPDVLPLIKTLAKRAGRSEEVETYLRGDVTGPLASSTPGITAKDIDKDYVAGLIQTYREGKRRPFLRHPQYTRLRMGVTEISNADYQLFLEDLLRQRRFDLIDSVAIPSVDMTQIVPESLRERVEVYFAKSGHPAFANYPLINVSHHAARLYARWLTEVYNADPKRKDGRNVIFRLPTMAEFEYAQRGGKESAPYSWGGPYYRNIRGCLMANFNTLHPESVKEFTAYIAKVKSWGKEDKQGQEILEKKGDCDFENDGGFLTVAVDAYFPNDYGLYNITGNAAEMLAEEGKVSGGSWLDPSYEMQNGVVVERELPHPSTGFRLIMEYRD